TGDSYYHRTTHRFPSDPDIKARAVTLSYIANIGGSGGLLTRYSYGRLETAIITERHIGFQATQTYKLGL
ncbi:hypothetical protein J6590_104479, partial [Homalodisca vitripennis]